RRERGLDGAPRARAGERRRPRGPHQRLERNRGELRVESRVARARGGAGREDGRGGALSMLLSLLLLAPLQGGAADTVRVERDILCRTIDGYEQRLDATLPATPGPHPAILLVHGGSWKHGERSDMQPFADLLVRDGYTCFCASYRLAPAHRWPAQIDDCLYAVQFVRANAERFGVDPARIGALGLSAGGHH